MQVVIFLSLMTLPFTLAATKGNTKASAPDISASITNFRAVLESNSGETSSQDIHHLNKLESRKCKNPEGWKCCVPNCIDECAKKPRFRGCNGED
ncbi:hypothetical protein FLONG3_9422 [Fusarium longipes]|uniref:Uncharacterized protein n=1 Tax=Fusarium longipes TaxID=694270 RepID=A0A395RXU8_9HYPO|nr:hypothetical protein FLONG3_9422 [Fusarium longipes]